jgi:hypothetical protein
MLPLLPFALLAVARVTLFVPSLVGRVVISLLLILAQVLSLSGSGDAHFRMKPDYKEALRHLRDTGTFRLPATSTAAWELENVSRYYAGRGVFPHLTVLPPGEAVQSPTLNVFVHNLYSLDRPHLADLRDVVGRSTVHLDVPGLRVYQIISRSQASSGAIPTSEKDTAGLAPDRFGGLPVKVSEPSRFFKVKKLGHRWVFVTPEGNAFWMLGVFGVDVDTRFTDLVAKYGSRATWAAQATRRVKAWGFNTLAEYASGYTFPGVPGVEKLPFMVIYRPSFYGLTNAEGRAPGPFKDLVDCLDATYTGWRGGNTPDVFDPNFDAFANAWMQRQVKDPYWGGLPSPWVVGITIDETDDLLGFGPGPEIRAARLHPHIGWFAIAAAPTKPSSPKWRVSYADPKVYTKYALRDFLQAKYGAMAALNTAWGSNYTSWDSAGGYGVGTGLLDENGRHITWLGSAEGTLQGAASVVVADLDAFLYQYAKQYFAVTTHWVRKYAPNQLAFSPASLNGWGGLTRKPILQAAGQYVDVLNAGVGSQTVLEKTAQYAGDKPVVPWEGYVANPDSGLSAYPNPPPSDSLALALSFKRQHERGQNYAKRLNFLLSATTSAGVAPIVGLKFWGWTDSWGEKLNWGLVSLKDNAYDGKEAVVAPGTDPWGYRTGAEMRDYGDLISGVRQANHVVIQRLAEELQRSGVRSSSASRTPAPERPASHGPERSF